MRRLLGKWRVSKSTFKGKDAAQLIERLDYADSISVAFCLLELSLGSGMYGGGAAQIFF